MKRVFDFGKIDYFKTGRKTNRVAVEINLYERGGEKTFTIDRTTKERIHTGETTPKYYEFTASAMVWNARNTDVIAGGQCLDELSTRVFNPKFKKIYKLWEGYHLNGMHAGTPEQEKAVEEWKAAGNKYEYAKVCEYLKSINLYEVNFTGKSTGKYYNNELYKYGHAWIVEDLPEDIINEIKALIND